MVGSVAEVAAVCQVDGAAADAACDPHVAALAGPQVGCGGYGGGSQPETALAAEEDLDSQQAEELPMPRTALVVADAE